MHTAWSAPDDMEVATMLSLAAWTASLTHCVSRRVSLRRWEEVQRMACARCANNAMDKKTIGRNFMLGERGVDSN